MAVSVGQATQKLLGVVLNLQGQGSFGRSPPMLTNAKPSGRAIVMATSMGLVEIEAAIAHLPPCQATLFDGAVS
jgi:hypothetical protein